MLAIIERRGYKLQTGLYISPIRHVCAILLTIFNKTDVLNNYDSEKIRRRLNTDSTPTHLRPNSDSGFFVPLPTLEIYPDGTSPMLATKHLYTL